MGFIHKTESYRHCRDARSWGLGTLLLWFLGAVKFGLLFFSGEKLFGKILRGNSTFYFGGPTYFFFVFFITSLPPWDPPDAWRRPHPKQILYSRTALSTFRGAIPTTPLGSTERAWTFGRHSGILWGPGRRRGIAQKLCDCWNGTRPPSRVAPDGALWRRARLIPDSHLSFPTRP